MTAAIPQVPVPTASMVDIYIHPDIQGLDAASFGNKNSAKMIKAGEDAARSQWNQLSVYRKAMQSE